MKTKVVVLPEREFQTWLVKNSGAKPGIDSTATINMMQKAFAKTITEVIPAEQQKEIPRGFALLNDKGCTTCHTLDGTPMTGLTYKGIFGKKQIVISDDKECRELS